ncbi:MAG: hypothetical protein VX498_11860 [Myxococcota bacterium]|nr:hypothetical protein [Myxococcota bacterium]
MERLAHRRLVALWVLLTLSGTTVPGVLRAESDGESYEFLRRQGALLEDYGKHAEALESLNRACATEEGSRDSHCWLQLATLAERSHRIDLAIRAWERLSAFPGREGRVGKEELQRLRGVYGELRVRSGVGRHLPSFGITLQYEGLLIDPLVKSYLSKQLSSLAEEGFQPGPLWLPEGRYSHSGVTFDVVAGHRVDLVVPADLIPWRPQAFGLEGQGVPRAMGGPWELGFSLVGLVGGSPGLELGLTPASLGVQVRLARQLGPIKIGGGLEMAVQAVEGNTSQEGYGGPSTSVLGDVGIGVLLALRRSVYLTPHLGVVGGRMGRPVLGCLSTAEGVVWAGKCRIAAFGGGARAGAELTVVPPGPRGRAVLRFALFGDVVPVVLQAEPGTVLSGSLPGSLVQVERWRYVHLRGGFSGGVGLRF